MTDPQGIDQVFINKLTEIVLANLSDENFDVEKLARSAGMSRSNIHRRLKASINLDASRFIREIRLQKAMELLITSSYTVAETAFKVGFGSPAYFTKCFHEHYGYPPGEARKRSSGDGSEQNIKEIHQSRKNDVFRQVVKKKAFPILAAFVLVIVTASVLLSVRQHRSEDLSIVVLPFKNLSDDQGNQYFADGIMEDILNNLYHVTDLRVVSRTTSEHFRDAALTAGDIGGKVNAGNVLEGSVRRYGDNIRISVQLIDAGKDQHLWSENYDRKLNDIIGVQGEIALDIAERLRAVITDDEVRKMKKVSTKNPEAYDNYLRGRFLLHQANSDQRADISAEGLSASLQYYEKAIALDSGFAEAYAGLANAWYNLCAWGWYQPYNEGVNKAMKYCAKALEIDPDCAEAHAVKGIYLTYPEHKLEESLNELQTSIRLNPNFSTARQWYAQVLMITGPVEEARVQIDRALELEQYFWVVQNLSSWIYYFEEKYDKGLEACQTARDLNPNSSDNIWLFVLHYSKLGEGEKAVKELQGLFNMFPSLNQYSVEVMDAFNNSGIEGIYKWLIDANQHKPVPMEGLDGHPFYISWWYAFLGDRQNSIYWLEKTLKEEHIPRHYFNLIATNPDFDVLRADPRFLAIIEKEGLNSYNNRPPR